MPSAHRGHIFLSPGDVWSFPECKISIRRATQAMTWERSIKALMRAIGTVQLTSTCDRTVEKIRGRIPRSWCDRTSIVVRSSRNRGAFGEIVAHDNATIDSCPTSRPDQTAAEIRRNFPLKLMYSLLSSSIFD